MQGRAELPVPDELPGAVAIHARHRLAHDVVGELLSTLAQQPPVVRCDLNGLAPVGGDLLLADLEPLSYYVHHWPGTVVVLHTSDEVVRAELTGAHLGDLVLVHDSWAQAMTEAMQVLPEVLDERLYMAPVATAAREARRFVSRVLRRWQLDDLIDPAVLVTSELVTNAESHAQTVLELHVSHTGARLRVAVSDRGGGMPMQRSELVPDMALNGRGILLVHHYARGWGVLLGRPRGKTVWVVLDEALSSSA